jgi:hypothetical protein
MRCWKNSNKKGRAIILATAVVSQLVEVFREAESAGRPHALLLVTKGGVREAAALLAAPPCPNVIISFSVNNAGVARRYERGAAAVADRMEAARRLKAAGWRVRPRAADTPERAPAHDRADVPEGTP